ncbi:MAG: hypothetical protein LBS21_13230 [Clostridiales bacterium]|jgi:hypothetical protein|nr:hypothetical protein [Clostridiales bacterium]
MAFFLNKRKLKAEKWLLVFVGAIEGDASFLDSFFERISEVTHLDIPIYEIMHISKDISKKIPATFESAENEPEEIFEKELLSPAIKVKNKIGATQVAFIFSLKAFVSDEAFKETVRNGIFNNDCYYAICSKGNLLNADRQKGCHEQRGCALCNEFDGKCENSDLLRLIWLMYEKKDTKVLEVFEKVNEKATDKS